MRIASLVPAATETLFAMGIGDQVVATSHACDHPPAARTLPAATRARMDLTKDGDGTLSSAAIDARVREHATSEEPFYEVLESVIHHTRPDLIVTQDACSVCGITPVDVGAALSRIEPSAWPTIVALHAHTLDEVFEDIRRLGEAAGAPDAASALVDNAHARLAAIDEAVRKRTGAPTLTGETVSAGAHESTLEEAESPVNEIDGPAIAPATNSQRERPTVVVLDWLDPPMVAGHWVPDMVVRAGGRPLLVGRGSPSAWTTIEALQEADPDVLVLAPCGFDRARTRAEVDRLDLVNAWGHLRAVAEDRVIVLDGNALISRPGPRLVEGVAALAEAIHGGGGVDTPAR